MGTTELELEYKGISVTVDESLVLYFSGDEWTQELKR